MELQLSPEPVQGRWRIMVKRESAAVSVQEFEVREFVLPKFEVNINPPSFIRFNQASDNSVQKINIGICAKYVTNVTDSNAPENVTQFIWRITGTATVNQCADLGKLKSK
jgi:sporulation-control protein spo0M